MSDTTIRRPIKWHSSADTNVGMVRKVNEDAIMSNPKAGIWAVADGMGGHEAGTVASNMIVKSLEAVEYTRHLNDYVVAVEDLILDVNHRILEYAEIMLDGRTLGSTLVSLIIKGQVGVCLWAGDSRLYLLRNNELIQISRDHSQVEEMLSQGLITEDEVENHPDSNVITRAVGTSDELYIDINIFDVQVGDIFLLCSDGLYNTVSDEDIVLELKQNSIDDGVKNLVVKALENGAPDNVSIIIVKGGPVKAENH